MGTSVGNQNPWQTYDTYKDCSQGICSIYCPQWCYIIFPPPPPFSLPDGDGGGSGTDFSPLIIAVIGILASAFILVSYYTIISKYCRRRSTTNSSGAGENTSAGWTNESSGGPAGGGGLDETIIKSITVWRYKKSSTTDDSGSGNDCSVCLSEFQENESLRLLPKCNHSFHLPCIDTWLKSNPSCPLCRADINALQPPQPQPPPSVNQETSPAPASVYVQEYQYRSNDSVLVVEDLERQVINNNVIVEGIIRRSASLNCSSSSSSSSNLSIGDILLINEDDDEIRDMELEMKKIGRLKRSVSTGRFMFHNS